MGLLSRLLGIEPTKPRPTLRQAAVTGPGHFLVPAVGESRYRDAFEWICGPPDDVGEDREIDAVLILEDENPYDDHAVRIEIDGRVVGYLSRSFARAYREWLASRGTPRVTVCCRARIRGGWDRGSRGRGEYGVTLDLPKPPAE